MKEYIVEIKKNNNVVSIEYVSIYDEAWQLARELANNIEVKSVSVRGI